MPKTEKTLNKAVRQLAKKRDIRIDAQSGVIEVLRGKKASNDHGIGSWGNIDFLRKKHGFFHYQVGEFSIKKNNLRTA